MKKKRLNSPELKKIKEFYAKQNLCIKSAHDYQKEWRQEHPEQVRAYQKKWRQEHPEQVRELGKKWRTKNREKFLASHRAQSKLYREKNKEKIYAYYKKNQGKLLEQARQKYRSKHPFPIRLSEAELKARRKARYQRWGRKQRENLTDHYVIQCLKKFGFKKADCTPRMIAAKRRQLKKRQKNFCKGKESKP